jgi:hypothetical protein
VTTTTKRKAMEKEEEVPPTEQKKKVKVSSTDDEKSLHLPQKTMLLTMAAAAAVGIYRSMLDVPGHDEWERKFDDHCGGPQATVACMVASAHHHLKSLLEGGFSTECADRWATVTAERM